MVADFFPVAPAVGTTEVSTDLLKPGEARGIHFEGALPKLKSKSAELQYEFDLAKETFEIFVPENYSGGEPFGLFAFIDSQNKMMLPKERRSREKI